MNNKGKNGSAQPNMNAQQMLMKVAQEKNDRASEMMQEALAQPFPAEMLSSLWIISATRALERTTPLMQRISLKEFGEVMKWVAEYSQGNAPAMTFFQFGIMSNSLESVTCEQLGLHPEVYVGLVKEAVQHIEFYSEKVDAIKKKIQEDVDQEFLLKSSNSQNGSKFIKGQA